MEDLNSTIRGWRGRFTSSRTVRRSSAEYAHPNRTLPSAISSDLNTIRHSNRNAPDGATQPRKGEGAAPDLGGTSPTPLPFGLGPAPQARSNSIHSVRQKNVSGPDDRARPRVFDRAAIFLRPSTARRLGAFVARGRRARPSAAVPSAERRTAQQTEGAGMNTRIRPP
jgi:hypothetical protein